MFSGGHDGTIRYWRLNADSEAYCLRRPPDGFVQTGIATALTTLEKTSVSKQVNQSVANSVVGNTVDSTGSLCSNDNILDDQSIESDTSSVINYKTAKNLYKTIESVCSLQCSENYLLSGDDGGELILWNIFTTNADVNNSHYHSTHVQDTPYIVVLPLCRFHNNGHNPMKAVMSLKQVSNIKSCFIYAIMFV